MVIEVDPNEIIPFLPDEDEEVSRELDRLSDERDERDEADEGDEGDEADEGEL